MPKRKTHEEFINDVKSIKFGEYSVLGKYINNKTPILIKHIRCGIEWEVRPDNFLNKTNCLHCFDNIRGNSLKFSKEELLNKINSLDEKYEVIGDLDTVKQKTKVKHLSCGYIWSPQLYDLLNKKSVCPKCSNNAKKDTCIFKKEVFDLTKNEYDILGIYKNNNTKIEFYHIICNQNFYMKPNDFLQGQRCPICKESKGEQKIRKWLTDKNVKFEVQYTFSNCINKKCLPFDFAIFNDDKTLKCLIEYDGEFHYKPILGIKHLKYQKSNDEIKNKYCKNNNINLIRIPYWEFDNVEDILKIEFEG